MVYNFRMPSFIEERKDYLLRFEHLLHKAQVRRGLRGFSRDELYELGMLYRMAAGDLAKARSSSVDRDTVEYFNGLLGTAHNIIYRGESQPIASFLRFVTSGFPRLFRRHFRVILIATLVMFLPAIWAYVAVLYFPSWSEVAIDPTTRKTYEQSLDEKGPSELAAAIENKDMGVASAFIILNNIRVCIYSFAGGILFGVMTIYLLMQNGLLLGGIAAVFVSKGPEFSLYFFSGVLPHGVLELPAICISGGAGLLLGKALLMPGEFKRVDALKKSGREAAGLLLGVALTLVFAGLIEGFITPLKIGGTADVPVLMYFKLSFAVIVFALFVSYLVLTGRNTGEKPLEFVGREIDELGKFTPRGIYRTLRSDTQEF